MANQLKRADPDVSSIGGSSNYNQFYDSRSAVDRTGVGMYTNDPTSTKDAEIADILKNDKDLRQLAKMMPAGTKVAMPDGRDGDLGAMTKENTLDSLSRFAPQSQQQFQHQQEELGSIRGLLPESRGGESREQAQAYEEMMRQYESAGQHPVREESPHSEEALYRMLQEESKYREASTRKTIPSSGEIYPDEEYKSHQEDYNNPLIDQPKAMNDPYDSQLSHIRNYQPIEDSYQGSEGSEMNSFLGGRESPEEQKSSIESNGRYDHNTEAYRDETQQDNGEHRPASALSDRELISKLLDMLKDKEDSSREKERAHSIEEGYSSFKHDDSSSRYFKEPVSSSQTFPPQEQQQQEFPATGRSTFPFQQQEQQQQRFLEEPYSSSQLEPPQPSQLQQQPYPQAQSSVNDLLSSLITTLQRSNYNSPYSPYLSEAAQQQSFFQQPTNMGIQGVPSSMLDELPNTSNGLSSKQTIPSMTMGNGKLSTFIFHIFLLETFFITLFQIKK